MRRARSRPRPPADVGSEHRRPRRDLPRRHGLRRPRRGAPPSTHRERRTPPVTGTTAPHATTRDLTAAGPLKVDGEHIVDALGRTVHVRGINVVGLESSATATIPPAEIVVAREWGANAIRLPLAENFAVPGDCSYRPQYESAIDAVVSTATRLGMLVILDLHVNAIVPCTTPRQQPMPDAKSVAFWRLMAQRYGSDPLVAFDLYNEPHGVTEDVWHSGGRVTYGGATYQAVGLQTLYDTIRATGSDALVIASGYGWATVYPADDPLTGDNIAYGGHAYTCPRGLPSATTRCTNGPDGSIYDPSALLDRWTDAARSVPVILTEFGFPSSQNGVYLSRAIAGAEERGFDGWTVFAFNGSTDGLFDLLRTASEPSQPAPSGTAVLEGLRSN